MSSRISGLLFMQVLLGFPALAAPPAQTPKPPPSDAECRSFPVPKSPYAFIPGETLEFDLDALGAQAGKMTLKVLPIREGTMPVEVRVQTNTFFSKVRRVKSVVQSYLNPQTLRPLRYHEETMENEVFRTFDVRFHPNHTADVKYRNGERSMDSTLRYGNEGLDVAGAVYLLRQIPLEASKPLCFDVYSMRRIWRVSGSVLGKEHVSLPIGEFEAWHLKGEAVRIDDHRSRREVHVWISDDEKRLPLAALGTIDLGAVRATLNAYTLSKGNSKKAQGKESLTW